MLFVRSFGEFLRNFVRVLATLLEGLVIKIQEDIQQGIAARRFCLMLGSLGCSASGCFG